MDKLKKRALGVAAGAAAAGAIVATKKKTGFCPACEIKKAVGALKYHGTGVDNFRNGTALTPPMGWSSWNLFRNHISEDLIYEIADAMKKSGLADCGYTYVNIDDCWQSSVRDENGRLQGDLTKFRSGIPALVKKVNALGLKLGIYTSNGTLTCEDLPSSMGYEALDADTFAEWGIEYFKYDYCHNVPIPTAAPDIDKIYIGKKGSDDQMIIQAEDGELRGSAQICEDGALDSGKYVTGLSANTGSLVFSDIEVPEDGEYVVTVGVRKFGTWRKYIEISANGSEGVGVEFPSTISRTRDGRAQAVVVLHAGKNSLLLNNPVASRMDSSAKQYMNMGRQLKRATAEYAAKTGLPEKPICYSICEWGFNQPWKWGYQAGNLWRTSLDILPNWPSILANYEQCVTHYYSAGPGNWNDPDMLEVGNGKLTDNENKAHFSLWCMMASPLILGNDLRKFVKEDGTPAYDDPVYKVITNKEMIAIDQDPLGMQARRYKSNVLTDVLVKKLSDGPVAVCLFNKTSSPKKMSCDLNDIFAQSYIALPVSTEYAIHDVWGATDFANDGVISSVVEGRSVRVLICRSK